MLAEQEMAKLRDPEAMKGLKTATLSTRSYEKFEVLQVALPIIL